MKIKIIEHTSDASGNNDKVEYLIAGGTNSSGTILSSAYWIIENSSGTLTEPIGLANLKSPAYYPAHCIFGGGLMLSGELKAASTPVSEVASYSVID